jgi:hypothetical protein
MRMKKPVVFTLLLSLWCGLWLACLPAAQAADLWWEYMARYDKELGVVNVNLSLHKLPPAATSSAYPWLVITGSTYKTSLFTPLPDDKEKKRLKLLAEQELAIIRAAGPSIEVGSFTYAGEHTHYVYVQRTQGIEKALAKLYSQNPCQKCLSFTSVRKDETWNAYNKFLYPNPQTREFYKQRLAKMGFKHEDPEPAR